MDGYLLDTNILTYLFDPSDKRHAAAQERLSALPPDAPIYVSAVTLGEIEYGHRCEGSEDTDKQQQFNTFLKGTCPQVLDVRGSTRLPYGGLRAKLFDRYAPAGLRRKGLRPEQLVDPVTSKELGIQENDLWLAAQAMEYNLILVSNDKMNRIRDVSSRELRVENWAVP